MSTVDIVVMGASAGGVGSLQRVVEDLPADFPAAIVIAMHLREGLRSKLPEILSRAGVLPATHPVNNESIKPGHIYVAPADVQLTVVPGRIRVAHGTSEHGHRPAIDPLFCSAAIAYGPRAIGVILSGLLHDGTAGLLEIKRAGGLAIVQDPADTAWPSMPQSALSHVDVDYMRPAGEIGSLLARLAEEERA